jgi:hypothetical protein
MAFPHMPPVNMIRRLLMFEDAVPRRLRFWIIVFFAFCYQIAGCVYLAAMPQMMGEPGFLSEDYTMTSYCTLIGLNVIFPMLFRWKFGLHTRQLFFISTGALIGCNVLAMYACQPWMLWVLGFLAGYFKMMGMFGCMSTIQLNITPTRNFAVFFPVIYVIVCSSIQLTGFIDTYVTYFTNWRMMHWVIISLMLIIDGIVYFLMKHDHRSGPNVPLKGIDWVGQILWTVTCCIGAWIFTFGEHYDWWDSIEIWRGTWLFIASLAITLIHAKYKKEPYIALQAFTYPAAWALMLPLLGMAIIDGANHLLQPIYLGGILHYDSLNQASLNLPQIAGVVMGSILAYFILVRWRWNVKKYLYMTFGFATYYAVSMYFLCSFADTAQEMLYFGVFALGAAEAMMECIATYYLSQNIPFQHFFMNITIIGFMRCGFGTSIGGAFIHRVYHHATTYNFMVGSESLTANAVNPETMAAYAQQSLLQAIQDTYAVAAVVGFAVILVVLMSNYRSTITRYVPRLMAVRRWMTGTAPDPTL